MLFVPGVNSSAEEKALDTLFAQYSGIDAEKAHSLLVQYLADLAPGQTRDKAQYVEFKKMMRATGQTYTINHTATCFQFMAGLKLYAASLVKKQASTRNELLMNTKSH